MKIQSLNYDTAKIILEGFRYAGCKFSPKFYNENGMLVFNPKERYTVVIDIIDLEKGPISFIEVSYQVFCELYPQP